MICQSEIEKLKVLLPKNFIKVLHTKLNKKYSESLIQKVLSGQRSNSAILDAAIEIAENFKKAQESTKSRIRRL